MPRPFQILVLDDEPQARAWFNEFLGFNGYTVMAAPLERLRDVLFRSPYDLVIIGQAQGGAEAYEACELLRRCPRTEELPVLIVADLEDEDADRKAARAGATGILRKPLNMKTLLGAIRTLSVQGRIHRGQVRRTG